MAVESWYSGASEMRTPVYSAHLLLSQMLHMLTNQAVIQKFIFRKGGNIAGGLGERLKGICIIRQLS